MKIIRILAVLALTVAAFLGAPQARAADTATVSVLHGVPDATVDVWANGQPLLTNFAPGTLTDPQQLPAGSYDLKVVRAGAGLESEAVIEARGVQVPAGVNVTVVAHLDASGAPKLTPFVNDTAMVEAGKGRLTVRHTAAAPGVDVRADGQPAFRNLTNPNEASAVLPAGSVNADVVLAGTETVAIGPADVDVAEGAHTIVYAWGSAEANNLKLAVQVIDGMGSHPGGVPAGDGGAAAGSDAVRWALIGGTALLAAGGVLMLGRRRPVATRTMR